MHGPGPFGTQMHPGGFDSVYAPLLSAPLAARSSNALPKAMRDTDVNYYSLLRWELPTVPKSPLPGRTGAGWASECIRVQNNAKIGVGKCNHRLGNAGVVRHFT